ncbi:hypothetical protein Sango_0999200 [Sesamum angolense]|uniref:Uncharacterized protein n=1 Tax=Sesamum angolense TaxID=2727404 RepID=A0AAE1WZR8_9LAMI|nr:hypothetical protein Sango_0999200 [Sesamum angolense]
MTMFSAENRRFYGGCGGGYGEGFGTVMSQLRGYAFSSTSEANCIGSDLVLVAPLMAEDESRAESLNEGVESSSKDVVDIGAPEEDEKDVGWLQLSIGGGGHEVKQDLTSDQTSQKNDNGSSLVELELMPTSSSHSQMIRPLGPMPEFRAPRPVMNFAGFSPSYFLQQQHHHHHQGSSSSHYFPPHQEINWAFRPIPISIAAAASSSSSSSSFSSPSPLMAAAPSASYFARPFQLYAGVDMAPAGPPGVDFRVIQPPRRPHSGIWFMLQASQNQEKEPFLPQISKSYLRIK